MKNNHINEYDSDYDSDMDMDRDPDPPEYAGTSKDVEPANEVRAVTGQNASNSGRFRHGETPISSIPVTKYNPWKGTDQVLMVYQDVITNGSLATGNGSTAINAYTYRLNSIYDCRADATYVANASGADAADGTAATPSMREYWMHFYKYWTVVGARYRVRVTPTTQTQNDYELMVYIYEHGRQQPPLVNGAGTPEVIPHIYKRFHPTLKFHYPIAGQGKLDNGAGGIGDGFRPNTLRNNLYYSGTYNPKKIKHTVVEDENQQTWHKPTEVPPTREALTIHIQRSPMSENVAVLYKMEIVIEYIVQLKDLKSEYLYITDTTDLSAITDFAKQNVQP